MEWGLNLVSLCLYNTNKIINQLIDNSSTIGF
jgi:hypothetical protein